MTYKDQRKDSLYLACCEFLCIVYLQVLWDTFAYLSTGQHVLHYVHG